MLGKRLTCRGRSESATSSFVERYEDVQQAQSFVQVDVACLRWIEMRRRQCILLCKRSRAELEIKRTLYHPCQSSHCPSNNPRVYPRQCTPLLRAYFASPCTPLGPARHYCAAVAAERSVHNLDAAQSWHRCLLASGSSLHAAALLPSTYFGAVHVGGTGPDACRAAGRAYMVVLLFFACKSNQWQRRNRV